MQVYKSLWNYTPSLIFATLCKSTNGQQIAQKTFFKLSGKREEEYIEILSKKSGNMANNLSDTLWNLDMK